MSENNTSINTYGIGQTEEMCKKISEKVCNFLEKMCPPAAEEIKQALKNKPMHWQLCNQINIISKASEKLGDFSNKKAPAQLVFSVIEHGSWTDDKNIQKMWAGLLASSCTKDGRDESNLIFINILFQLTYVEVKILSYLCENSEKKVIYDNLIAADKLMFSIKKLREISGINDLARLSLKLHHLQTIGLTEGTFPELIADREFNVYIKPTPLALDMYVRSQGLQETPIEYFDLKAGK